MGGLHNFVRFTSGWLDQVLTVNTREKKNLLVLLAGGGEKELFGNMPEYPVLFIRSILRRN